MSYETDRITALEALVCEQAMELLRFKWTPITKKAHPDFADLIQEVQCLGIMQFVSHQEVVIVSWSARKQAWYCDDIKVDGITHWMLLPEVPKEAG